MKGLLLKDFYMIGKYCRSFIVILLVFLIVSCFGNDNTFFVIYPVLIAGMIPVTLISYDEREKWHIYSETLPYTRAQFVSAKYLIGLSFEFFVFIMSAAAQAYRMSSAGTFSIHEFLPFLLALFVIGLIGPALLLPFIFRFGAEKGRIAYYVLIGLLCAAGTMFASSGIEIPNELQSEMVMIFITILAITIFICSWGLSVFLYRKREL